MDGNCEKIAIYEQSYGLDNEIDIKSGLEFLMKSELVYNDNVQIEEEEVDDKINSENSEIENNVVENEEPEKLECKVISENNMKETYNVEINGVKIKNESKYDLANENINCDIEYSNKKDILIYHTHTCESYTKTENETYAESGNFRTLDLNYSVASIGDELTKCLTDKNYNVYHDKTYHDYPAYNGSYSRSMKTVQSILENMNNVQTIIDLHRDAVGSNSSYGPSVLIGTEKVSQLMFVIGTNGCQMEHENWRTNLGFAIKIQQKANEMYPGLFRPIIVRNSRYNQNLGDSAFIIEVGSTGNTLSESKGAMKYLSNVLSEVMK